jgi:UDP-glucose 6-dehydrogenase
MDKAKALLPNVTYVDDMNAVAEGCDALVVATEWDEFKAAWTWPARKIADASDHVRRAQSV